MVMPRDSARGRLRSHEACLNCSLSIGVGLMSYRRKKTRCPAEKPSCSSCVRLNQPCLYTSISRSSRGGPSDDRLAFLEEKVNLILSGSRPTQDIQSEKGRDGANGTNGISDTSYPTRAPSNEPINPVADPFFLGFGYEDSNNQPSSPAIAKAIDLYFEYCHRQPIWCFNREEVSDPSCLSEELVCCLLALTSRFSRDRDHLEHYGDSARSLVMLRMANGTVELETIESLCLLAYSSFLDGNIHLGRFHLGLALHLCRSATLDLESTYVGEGPTTERKKRLFWSLQCLEQSYGQQNGFLCVPSEILRAFYVSSSSDRMMQSESEAKPPPLPTDDLGCSTSSDIGIWSLAAHFGWVWSRVRTYVSDCARNRLKEPWRHDSMYSMVLSDLTEIENKLSQCHRYDSVKFYERTGEELAMNRDYWTPWLKLQFTYHCILTVLNHPFLYIIASQYNDNLAIPNAFWRRSSELVLLHATWLVRMIDMVLEKKLRLIDPFFGHAAAIAATVHLYYCCAADPRLKYKSKVDFTKCRKFLKTFVGFSSACAVLDQTLDKMTRIASGSEDVDYDWEPEKIHLSIPLMWDVLQVNCKPKPHEVSTGGLLHPSLTPTVSTEEADDGPTSTVEVIVAMSPNITVNTADGGQAAHMPPTLPRVPTTKYSPDLGMGEKLLAPADSLMTNTPWLWADASQFVDLENSVGYADSESALGNIEGFSTWWDFGNL
ncbi:transcriptional regulator family: Fungal Specific TF [Penicillium antarcticum]|uniref:transcriptional regulator family: Fungal Specific TF n=1 Tax=Penicillium antarcticum TaxID=416450 RepID=UPI00238EFE5D|nr:transcriptional regulator family: Fungal Specific TF [Penicillium antarcticum]KAJ5295471.1 transcriptional regulator family: Fungal Specific TF [Penicillium antarcticum]